MQYLFQFVLIVTILSYSITQDEVKICVAKNCDTQTTICSTDNVCHAAVQAFDTCFIANRYNITVPFNECKGKANYKYSQLMACYEACDYNLILMSFELVPLILIYIVGN